MKIACISDLHLDAKTAGLSRFDDAAVALDVFAEDVIDWGAEMVVMCGDLCDPHGPDLVRCICRAQWLGIQLERRADIKTVWLVGNHDVLENGSGTTTLDPLMYVGSLNVVMREPGVDLMQGHRFGFLPYPSLALDYDPEKVVRDWYTRHGPVHMIFSHLQMPGMHSGSESEEFPRGRDKMLPIALIRELFPDAVVVSGHYHTPCKTDAGVLVVGSLLNLTRADAANSPGYLKIEI